MLKNFVVMGDSYSAYEGYVPEGCLPCYGPSSKQDVYRIKDTDMWWYKLKEKVGGNLLLTAAASGSAISYTGWGGYSPDYSFIGRFEKLIKEGFFKKNKVDTFFIFGGTNDYWINGEKGEIKRENITEKDKELQLPAVIYYFDLVKKTIPDTRVIVLINDAIYEGALRTRLIEESKINGFECIALKDIEKEDGHPTVSGMTAISEQIAEYLNNN